MYGQKPISKLVVMMHYDEFTDANRQLIVLQQWTIQDEYWRTKQHKMSEWDLPVPASQLLMLVISDV